MKIKDLFEDWLYKIGTKLGDYAEKQLCKSKQRYFNIIFKKFEKQLETGWNCYEIVYDTMSYKGKKFYITVKRI